MAEKTPAELGSLGSIAGGDLVMVWPVAGPGPLQTVTAGQFTTYVLSGLGTASAADTGTTGHTLGFLDGANTWAAAQTFTLAPVFTDQAGTRAALGMPTGTAALYSVGASGAQVPLMNIANSWGPARQTFKTATVGGTGTLVEANAGLTVEDTGITYAAQFLRGTNSAGYTALFYQPRNDVNPMLFSYLGSTVGSITQNGTNTAFNTSSDGRRKPEHERRPYDPGDLFDRIQIYDLMWDTGQRSVLPVAQELYEVAPSWVTPGDDNPDARPGEDGYVMWQTQIGEPVAAIMAELKALRRRVRDLEDAVQA